MPYTVFYFPIIHVIAFCYHENTVNMTHMTVHSSIVRKKKRIPILILHEEK